MAVCSFVLDFGAHPVAKYYNRGACYNNDYGQGQVRGRVRVRFRTLRDRGRTRLRGLGALPALGWPCSGPCTCGRGCTRGGGCILGYVVGSLGKRNTSHAVWFSHPRCKAPRSRCTQSERSTSVAANNWPWISTSIAFTRTYVDQRTSSYHTQ